MDDLARRLLAGEKAALARALSLAEREPAAGAALMQGLADAKGHAHVVGVTGPPGAGKSTLVGALVRWLLGQGHSVAVLAVDPSSPVSGGALLGDRFRIGEAIEGRCFIRSTASRGSLGGLTAAAQPMVRLMDLAGYDLVIVETVGTGQSELDVAHLADTLLVAFPPGLGDEMQAIKAGILELADLLVVTKSDTPAASLACDSLRAVTHLWRHAPPIHAVSAVSGEGIEALVGAIRARAAVGDSSRRQADLSSVAKPVAERFASLWGRVQAAVPLAAGLRTTLTEPEGATLRVEIAPVATGGVFLLGTAVGAIAALAAPEGLRCSFAQPEPQVTSLVVEVTAIR